MKEGKYMRKKTIETSLAKLTAQKEKLQQKVDKLNSLIDDLDKRINKENLSCSIKFISSNNIDFKTLNLLYETFKDNPSAFMNLTGGKEELNEGEGEKKQ
jgi:hypothetical protein